MLMKIDHGSFGGIEIEIDRDPSENEYTKEAEDKLERIVKHDNFCKPGYRNDSIVDACIYIGILGGDIFELIDKVRDADWIGQWDYSEAWDKAKIVEPYAEGWLAQGDAEAFSYEIGFLARS